MKYVFVGYAKNVNQVLGIFNPFMTEAVII